MRDFQVATNDYAMLLNGIASGQSAQMGFEWVMNLGKDRLPTWLMVIEDEDAMAGASLNDQLGEYQVNESM